mgnify:CR=1 FL=1
MKKMNMNILNKMKPIMIKVKIKRLKKNNKCIRTNSINKDNFLMIFPKIFTKKLKLNVKKNHIKKDIFWRMIKKILREISRIQSLKMNQKLILKDKKL